MIKPLVSLCASYLGGKNSFDIGNFSGGTSLGTRRFPPVRSRHSVATAGPAAMQKCQFSGLFLTPACHFGGFMAKNAISAKNKNEGLSPRLLSVFLCVAAVKPYSSLECGEASRLWNSLQDFIDHIGCPLGVQPHHTGLHIRTADHRQGHGVGRTEFYDVDTVVSALKIG